jgi:hypothetical protein
MTLERSYQSISAVTSLIMNKLTSLSNGLLDIDIGIPKSNDLKKLKLFLYEVNFDPNMKNVSLKEGYPQPLWLILNYLLIAHDTVGNSPEKSHEALIDMGAAIRILQDNQFLKYDGQVQEIIEALESNPEILKLTFIEAPSELISKILGSVNDNYRFSISFQIRPVMIISDKSPKINPFLVGYDYKEKRILPEDKQFGINVDASAILSLEIDKMKPNYMFFQNEINDIEFQGKNLDPQNSHIKFCSKLWPINMNKSFITNLVWTITFDDLVQNCQNIIVGNHLISIIKEKEGKIVAVSKKKEIKIIPFLDSATYSETKKGNKVIKQGLTLIGRFIGSKDELIEIYFSKNNSIIKSYNNTKKDIEIEENEIEDIEIEENEIEDIEIEDKYKKLFLNITKEELESFNEGDGDLRLILRVNNEQSIYSPLVVIS